MEPQLQDRREYDSRLLKIEEKLDSLTSDVKDLVTAWRAASFIVASIKWLGGLSAAITAIYILMKDFK